MAEHAPAFELYSRCGRCGDVALFIAVPRLSPQATRRVGELTWVWQWRCAKCGNSAALRHPSDTETILPVEASG